MFDGRERVERWFDEIVQKFRQKGATSPDKAMTSDELGLPPRFEQAMQRCLGRLGVFVEVDGKYYLSEERLKQMEEFRSAGGGSLRLRSRMIMLRLLQLTIVVVLVSLLLVNFFVQSSAFRLLSLVLLVILLVIVVAQIYFMSRVRKRFSYQRSLN